jgi:Spy/CpxP family protein refolding chaperone
MKRATSFLNLSHCAALLLALVAAAAAQTAAPAQADEKWLPPAMAEIGLTADQKAKLKPVVLEQRKQAKAVREDATLNDAARQEKLRSINREANQQFKAILTPEQWTKLVEARKANARKNKATPAPVQKP